MQHKASEGDYQKGSRVSRQLIGGHNYVEQQVSLKSNHIQAHLSLELRVCVCVCVVGQEAEAWHSSSQCKNHIESDPVMRARG